MHKKNLVKRWFKREEGFTLIELLVVVAILGILAAIAVPSVGKFIGSGRTQSYQTELHNVQTSVLAMMTEAKSGKIDSVNSVATTSAPSAAVSDLHLVTSLAADGSTTLYLDQYMVGLSGTSVQTGCTYKFTRDGVVSQVTP